MNKELLKKAAANTCGMPPPPRPGGKGAVIGSRAEVEPVKPEKCFDEVKEVTVGGDSFKMYFGKGPEGCESYVVLFHGAGLCAMSWGLCASNLRSKLNVIAFDMRGHGATRCTPETDLSMDRLTADAINVIKATIPPNATYMIAGHSLGGALAASVCYKGKDELPGTLKGCIVVDVVEGTAIESLKHMKTILAKKPVSFKTLESAVQWGMTGAGVRNRESARASIPPQLVLNDGVYTWRTDLSATEPFWEGWFKGLDSWFLGARCPKLLLVASPDRLDRDLSMAHMQGKFQLSIVNNTGHYMQEDNPHEMANVISTFFTRHTAPIPGPRT